MNTHETFSVRKLSADDADKYGEFMIPATTKNGQLIDLNLPFIEIAEIFNQIVEHQQNEILESN